MRKPTTIVAGVGKTTKSFSGKVAARKWALAEAIKRNVPSFRLRNIKKDSIWEVYFVPAVAEQHGWDPQEALQKAKRVVRKIASRKTRT